MKNKAFTLVELVTVITILGILSVFVVPKLSQSYRVGNESAAQATLKIISAALENYLAVQETYPTAESSLTGANPPYLTRSYCGQSTQGYNYTCDLQTTNYTVTAAPTACGSTGSHRFTVTRGGTLNQSGC